MKDETPSGGNYVAKARGQMQTYVRRLLDDNDALRVAQVELESNNTRLREEAARLQDELRATHAQQAQLMARLHDIREVSEQRLTEYTKLETINANLANLYVASYQLHSTLKREMVLAAIQEIVVNLVGSEEFAVFERDQDGAFDLAASVGIEPPDLAAARERVAQATVSGETWVTAQHGDFTACIPLKIDEAVTGFIVIRRLLAHKSGLEPVDLELFDLLGTHAAMALYTSSLQDRFTTLEQAG